eukprot:scaffold5620_cov112-Isochrysis_galbana.AAC.1
MLILLGGGGGGHLRLGWQCHKQPCVWELGAGGMRTGVRPGMICSARCPRTKVYGRKGVLVFVSDLRDACEFRTTPRRSMLGLRNYIETL